MQLKTQLERTEATLEGEQVLRQKLTAEFEEVRPCPWSPPCARARGVRARSLLGGPPSAPHPPPLP